MSARCKSCGAPIIWAKTLRNGAIPVNAAPVAGGNVTLVDYGSYVAALVGAKGSGTHTSHFADCPNATQHRRKRS